MDIILQQHMPGLGNKAEIVTVKQGYGANYLIPQGFAILATKANKKMHSENLKQASHKQAKVREEAEALAKHVVDLNVVLHANASSDDNKIYGTITPLQVAQAMTKYDIRLHPRQVSIPTPIKEVGSHPVTLHLHKEVEVIINITVEAKA